MAAPLKIGFIGTGGIAQAHLRNLAQIEDAQVTAFCDLQLERAEKAAAEWDGAKAYTSIADMLDAQQFDAMYICLPPMAHGEAERALIERGIPFSVEKPLAVDGKLPRELSEAIAAKQLITSVGYQWRYIESLTEVKKFLDQAGVGMAMGYWLGGMPMVPWWRVQNMSGGQFVEQTTHITDILRYLCGEVVEVYAAYGHRVMHEKVEGTTAPDVGTVTLKLANGAVATIANTCLLPVGYTIGLNIFTGKGIVEVRNSNSTRIIRNNEDKKAEFSVTSHAKMLEDLAFLHAVRTGDASGIRSTYADALKTHEIGVAANVSAATGKPVRL